MVRMCEVSITIIKLLFIISHRSQLRSNSRAKLHGLPRRDYEKQNVNQPSYA